MKLETRSPSLALKARTIVVGLAFLLVLSGCERGGESISSATRAASAVPSSLPAGFPPLAVQPEYQSTPRYCLIAIGPNREKTMWTVIDGLRLFIDLNANGDLTDDGEPIAGEVEMSFQGTTYVNFFIGALDYGSIVHTDTNLRAAITDEDVRASINLFLDGFTGSANNSHLLTLEMNPEPAKASLVHFGGPISMGLYEEPQSVVAGDEIKFYGLVGTPGIGPGTLTALAHADIPADIHPKVVFLFPNKDAGQPDIEVTAYLKERC
jgi:hypothetical protein